MMKRIAILILLFSGCSPPGATNMTPLGDVRKIPIEGHDYFVHYKGGIIHSESCTNAAHQPQPWNVLTGSGIPRRVLSVPLQAPITYQPDFIYTNDSWVPNK